MRSLLFKVFGLLEMIAFLMLMFYLYLLSFWRLTGYNYPGSPQRQIVRERSCRILLILSGMTWSSLDLAQRRLVQLPWMKRIRSCPRDSLFLFWGGPLFLFFGFVLGWFWSTSSRLWSGVALCLPYGCIIVFLLLL